MEGKTSKHAAGGREQTNRRARGIFWEAREQAVWARRYLHACGGMATAEGWLYLHAQHASANIISSHAINVISSGTSKYSITKASSHSSLLIFLPTTSACALFPQAKSAALLGRRGSSKPLLPLLLALLAPHSSSCYLSLILLIALCCSMAGPYISLCLIAPS